MSVQQCILSLRCRDATCLLPTCQKMKRVVLHSKQCKRKTNGGCPIAKQLLTLCFYHAKLCQEVKCPMPFCRSTKQRLWRKQLQQWVEEPSFRAHTNIPEAVKKVQEEVKNLEQHMEVDQVVGIMSLVPDITSVPIPTILLKILRCYDSQPRNIPFRPAGHEDNQVFGWLAPTIQAVSEAVTEGDKGNIEHEATFPPVCGSLGKYVQLDQVTKHLSAQHPRVSFHLMLDCFIFAANWMGY